MRGEAFEPLELRSARMAEDKPFFLEGDDGEEEARRPIEQQLQRELVFVQEHEATLRGIELAISDATAQVPREAKPLIIRNSYCIKVPSCWFTK